MCDEAIRIAQNEKPKNRFNLIELAYRRLSEYSVHTHYILTACEVAFAAYRNKKRKSVPQVRRIFLKIDNQSYRLNHLLLRIPAGPRHYIFLTLQGSPWHLSFIDNPHFKKGSITITELKVTIALSKEVFLIQPLGFAGVDVNERNATMSATNGYSRKFIELAEVVEIKERYKELRAGIASKTKRDIRVRRRLLAKCGLRERNRTTQRVHKVTKTMVGYANDHVFGIKIEKLKGIRKLFGRGNGQGSLFRGRLNNWVFGETLRQIGYKAAWLGVPVYHVNPRGMSSNCPDCGSRVAPLPERRLYCADCDRLWDRDDLASKNIMACAIPQARPPKGSGERV